MPSASTDATVLNTNSFRIGMILFQPASQLTERPTEEEVATLTINAPKGEEFAHTVHCGRVAVFCDLSIDDKTPGHLSVLSPRNFLSGRRPFTPRVGASRYTHCTAA